MGHALRTFVLLAGSVLGSIGATAVQAEALHRARWVDADLSAGIPADLARPEGKTRWDLRGVRAGAAWELTLAADGDGGIELARTTGAGAALGAGEAEVYTDPSGGAEVERWLRPNLDPRLAAAVDSGPLRLEARRGERTRRLEIAYRRVGVGWIDLPSGPREVVLQRATLTEPGAATGVRTLYRWVDPRNGVVAEAWGSRGLAGFEIEGAAVVEQIVQGGTPLRLYADEFDAPILTRLNYGFERATRCSGDGTTPCTTNAQCSGNGGICGRVAVSALTPGAPATIGDLVAGEWDFSQNTLANYPDMREWASTVTPIDATETCNSGRCGFSLPGARLDRQDKDFDYLYPWTCDNGTTSCEIDSDCSGIGSGRCRRTRITLNAIETQQRASDVTIWLRGVIRKEGEAGSLGSGESRLCYADGRTPVPLFRFPHQDAGRFYMQVGDGWPNPADPVEDAFACEENVYNQGPCASDCGALACPIRTAGCTASGCANPEGNTFAGVQKSEVIGEGPVTLPSGHTFNALLVRSTAEFCTYLSIFGSCGGSGVGQVRVVNHLWQVPRLGTVVRLMSEQRVCDAVSFNRIEETDIKHGLFPPRSISVSAVDATSVELSWDPGAVTHRIDRYKVYWGTTSGTYAFDSESNPADVSFGGTSATIANLETGTEYFFTVTAVSDYTDPGTCYHDTCVTREFESLLYPLQISDGGNPVPLEVSATPSAPCTPTLEVAGLTVTKAGGGMVRFCWNPVGDPCADGYRLLGSASPTTDAGYSVVATDVASTCVDLSPAATYFLVVGEGPGGTGPWGHYGH